MTLLDEFTSRPYDYVIVGGGTAGLVLANRLSEDSSVSVAVIEAGQCRLDDPVVDIPARCFEMHSNPSYDWAFSTTPQKGNYDRVHHLPRGKMLGGSSGSNYMVYVRGSAEEYDDWAELVGDEGWSGGEMMKYHRKYECFETPSPNLSEAEGMMFNARSHGTEGPIHTSFQDTYMPIEKDFLEAATELTSIEQPSDAWGGKHTGFTNLLSFVTREGENRGKRSYAARAYYEPVKGRRNLTLLCGATVAEVLLDDGNRQAIGLKVIHEGKHGVVKANREVILCCGTIKSPQLLELSGIGNPKTLEKAGVKCLVPLSGVGENFQDHVLTTSGYALKPGNGTMDAMSDPAVIVAALAQYEKSKDGPLASISPTAGFYPANMYTTETELKEAIEAIHKTQRAPEASDFYRRQLEAIIRYLEDPQGCAIHLGFIGLNIDLNNVHDQSRMIVPQEVKEGDCHTMAISQSLQHPVSRGSIHITSLDPFAQPAIDPAYLTHPADLIILAAAMRMSTKLIATPPLAEKIEAQLTPSPNVDLSDIEQAKEWIRKWCMTQYHPIGTCAMGAVVDARLRVKGVTGLRVCDASVFPNHVSGNICSSVYAVAEKGADLIRQDWQQATDQDVYEAVPTTGL